MGGNKKHRFRIVIWIFLVLVVLIAGASVFVFFRAEKYINQNLSELISKKSRGLYSLSFENISLDIRRFSITISDVSLQPDSLKSEQLLKNNPKKIFYAFDSPLIEIQGIDPFSLYQNKRFYCSKITVVQPNLELSGEKILNRNSTNTFDKLFIEMQPLFRKYIKQAEVKEIEFRNANYGFYNSVGDSVKISNASRVSMEIKNFRTDSSLINMQNNYFESDDILIRMNKFKNNLGDSLHILTIDSLEYSLKSSDIFAYNFKLKYNHINPQRSLYDVVVPRAHIKSKSITRLNFNDSLRVEFLQFEHPKIRFYLKENPKQVKIEDIRNFELHKLFEKQFTKIKIDSFVMHQSNLEFFRQPDFSNYQQKFDSLTISLSGFSLDSISAENKNKLFYADNLEMLVAGYNLRLADDSHDFFADSMYFSSYKNLLGIKNIRILPIDGNKITRTEANITCKNLSIREVNLKTLYHTRVLPTKQIEIIGPEVNLKYHTNIRRAKEKRQAGLLFELVTAYSNGVYADRVKIENGLLKIQNVTGKKVQGYFETGFNFDLSGFSLDSTSISESDKLFYAHDFDLAFSNYQMKLIDNLHKLNIDKILVASKNRKVDIEKLRLLPVIKNVTNSVMQKYNRSELYNVYVPKISLWGINLSDAFFYNKLSMSRFSIYGPRIYFENFGLLRQRQNKGEFTEFYQLIFNYLSDFSIKEINVPNGHFSWVNHTKKGKTTSFDNEFEGTLYNFRLNDNELNKQRLLFSDNFDITVKDQLFQLSDSVHNLRAGEINLSTANKSVTLKNAVLYPVITSKKYPTTTTTFQISIPSLNISNFNFSKAYYSKNLVLNQLELNNPKFQVYTKKGAKKLLDFNQYSFPLPAFIKSLKLDRLKINRGEVITYETAGLDHFAGSNFKVDLLLTKIAVANNKNNRVHINTQNLITSISDFKTPLGKTHDLEIEQVDFNREKKSIFLKNLKVNPFIKNQNSYTISLPKMSFSNFDISSALTKNNFNFDNINIANPTIKIEITDSIKGDKLNFAQNLDLFPYVEPYLNEIHVKQLDLSGVNLHFNWFSKELINKEFDLRFDDINIGKNFKPVNILNSNKFELTTHDLYSESKNKLYSFSAGKLTYNSENHTILFDKVKILPLIKREEFPRLKGFQTDYLTASTDFIKLQNIDENLWLKERILDGSAVIIGKSDIRIFRNKRFPFNQNQRPPWPQDLLRNIKQPFKFDSLIVNPTYIHYSELTDISDVPGYIDFSEFKLKTDRLSNIPSEIKKHKLLNVDASAMLLKKSLLTTHFTFDLSGNYQHTATGSLHPIEFKEFNVMASKSAPIKIESGRINQFDFDLKFTEDKSSGSLNFAYDNFEISVLEYKRNGFKKSKWASFWANSLVVNKKNPKGNTLQPVKISYVRDEQRSIINYWWKSIFTGAKTVIGIENETKK